VLGGSADLKADWTKPISPNDGARKKGATKRIEEARQNGKWCRGRDLNPHGLEAHWLLRPARLPSSATAAQALSILLRQKFVVNITSLMRLIERRQ
jgi:hypothetical protein